MIPWSTVDAILISAGALALLATVLCMVELYRVEMTLGLLVRGRLNNLVPEKPDMSTRGFMRLTKQIEAGLSAVAATDSEVASLLKRKRRAKWWGGLCTAALGTVALFIL